MSRDDDDRAKRVGEHHRELAESADQRQRDFEHRAALAKQAIQDWSRLHETETPSQGQERVSAIACHLRAYVAKLRAYLSIMGGDQGELGDVCDELERLAGELERLGDKMVKRFG
jgi:hypothetical protein